MHDFYSQSNRLGEQLYFYLRQQGPHLWLFLRPLVIILVLDDAQRPSW